MKKALVSCIILLLVASHARATHIFGGELLYTHDSANSYKISLTLYGDCSGASFPYLANSVPQVLIYRGGVFYDSLRLAAEPGTGVEVSPVCPAKKDSTSCKGGKLPGVKEYVYSAHIIIPTTSTNWQFIFEGDMGASQAAGRSNAITNINIPAGGSPIYLISTLNNTLGANNSPGYTTIPTPFYCINVFQQYNQGASDVDGDSLGYEMTKALINGSSVAYIYPYTYLKPMAADTFDFNPVNGQLSFTANLVQDAVIVTKVTEYKHGIVVGTSMREMTFVILSNCSTMPPVAKITSITGGYNKGNTITLCQGTSDLSFNISAYDSSNDRITVTTTGLPAMSSLSVIGNTTLNPQLYFNWHTASLPNGVYNFFVTYKNDHCPLSSSQTVAYTIIITAPYTLSTNIIQPTQCVHKAYVQLNLADGVLPRIVTLKKGATTIKTYKDSTGVIRDSLATGNYTAYVSSPNGACPVTYDFSISDSGSLPDPYATPIAYCRYDTASQLHLSFVDSSTVQWYDATMQPISAAPIPSTQIPGKYTWYVSEHYKVCDILFDTVAVTIYDLPKIKILDQLASVCYGDKLILEASGGMSYKWESTGNKVVKDKDGSYFSMLFDTATYTVVVTDEHHCTDSATESYYNIQRCCLFTYPNAFTPNGDGRNDKFRVLTYGNMENFELDIFDRWGQRVFISANPTLGWDGTYHGQPCEIGTYFYLLRAKCLTGTYEEHKGDIMLIR